MTISTVLTTSRRQVRRGAGLLAVATVATLAVTALTSAPTAIASPAANAATAKVASPIASSVPLSGTWSVSHACGSPYVGKNCAEVRAILPAAGQVLVAGIFDKVVDPSGASPALSYSNLAAFTPSGQPVTTFAHHTFNGTIFALTLSEDGSTVYAGGLFSKVDGVSAAHVAAFDAATGARKKTFSAAVSGTVRTLLAGNGRLYVGGTITSAHSQPRTRLAALDPTTGAVDPTFLPQPADTDGLPAVYALTLGQATDGHLRLYVGGHFTTFGGSTHSAIAAIDPNTGAVDDTFKATVEEKVDDPHEQGDQIIAVDGTGGRTPGIIFAAAGHLNRAYRYTLTGQRVWTFRPSGDVQAAAMSGNTIYFGGHWRCVISCSNRTQPPSDLDNPATDELHLVSLNYDGNGKGAVVINKSWWAQAGPWQAPYYFGVWSLQVINGNLWTGGVFGYIIDNTGKTWNTPKLALFPGA